jgi:hypothetical protein
MRTCRERKRPKRCDERLGRYYKISCEEDPMTNGSESAGTAPADVRHLETAACERCDFTTDTVDRYGQRYCVQCALADVVSDQYALTVARQVVAGLARDGVLHPDDALEAAREGAADRAGLTAIKTWNELDDCGRRLRGYRDELRRRGAEL